MSQKTPDEPSEPTPSSAETIEASKEPQRTPWADTYSSALRHFLPFGIEVIDTGGNSDEDRAALEQAAAIIDEAGARVLELFGVDPDSGRDLGTYGTIYSSDDLPPEYTVAFDCILRAYRESIFAWQRKAASWHAHLAMQAEADRAAMEEETSRKASDKPKRRRRRKKTDGGATTDA